MTARPVALLIPAAALAFLAAGCGSTPADMTVHGTVTGPNLISGAPVQDGSQVTVTDPSGKVIGFASLSEDSATENTILFRFTVKVPEGEPSYGITIQGVQGVTRFTQAQMKQGPGVCIGDAC